MGWLYDGDYEGDDDRPNELCQGFYKPQSLIS